MSERLGCALGMKETVSVHDMTQETCVCLPIYISVAITRDLRTPHLCALETSRNHLASLHQSVVHMETANVMFT